MGNSDGGSEDLNADRNADYTHEIAQRTRGLLGIGLEATYFIFKKLIHIFPMS